MTVKWVQLTPKLEPVPEPYNKDSRIRTPKEQDDSNINPKYGFPDEFQRFSFEGTKESMQYKSSCHSKLSLTRKMRGVMTFDLCVKGGPDKKL